MDWMVVNRAIERLARLDGEMEKGWWKWRHRWRAKQIGTSRWRDGDGLDGGKLSNVEIGTARCRQRGWQRWWHGWRAEWAFFRSRQGRTGRRQWEWQGEKKLSLLGMVARRMGLRRSSRCFGRVPFRTTTHGEAHGQRMAAARMAMRRAWKRPWWTKVHLMRIPKHAAAMSDDAATSEEPTKHSLANTTHTTRPNAATPLRDQLEARGVVLRTYRGGQHRTVCPQCGGGSQKELSLSIHIDEDGQGATWNCFRARCGWSGAVGRRSNGNAEGEVGIAGTDGFATASKKFRDVGMTARKPEMPVQRPKVNFQPPSAKVLQFFRGRCIPESVVERNGIMQENCYSPATAREELAIAFPYRRDGELISVKYRGPRKSFWQSKNCEKIFYGLDDIKGKKEIIVVEGELDKLALEVAGYTNVVSVPDGAPRKAKEDEQLPPPEEDTKFSYLWNCREYLDHVEKVVLATDSDEPGQALAEELSRRLGKERCWKVRWVAEKGHSQMDGTSAAQENAEQNGDAPALPKPPKDANDLLRMEGPDAVKDCIRNAEPYPIRGLFRFTDFYDEIESYYALTLGEEMGVSTGWNSVDEVYKVVPGELTVVTGVPNSGKSEWIDALMVNLAEDHGWSFALCSMENKVRDHARKLIEKRVRAPFFDAPYGQSRRRMSRESLAEGVRWLDDHFHLIRYEDDQLPSVDWVLNLARSAVLRFGIRGLVIDPYNELDHQRPHNMSETEYVSQMITKIKRFAQHHDCHVWFVAHPRIMRGWQGEAPNLYDISGSAHFINKCDNGLVVHRSRRPEDGAPDEVQILLRKVRNKASGRIGDTKLRYDITTGRYSDLY